MSATVYIGLGANLPSPIGSPRETLAFALRRIAALPGTRIETVSSLYETEPWGIADQPAFLNACAKIATRLAPPLLLETLLGIERQAGRERGERYGPRSLDLDILAYNDRRIEEHDLALPHPRIAERAFVLVPLAEIAPDLIIEGETVRNLLARIDGTGIERLGAMPRAENDV